jgi:hypothetical protein
VNLSGSTVAGLLQMRNDAVITQPAWPKMLSPAPSPASALDQRIDLCRVDAHSLPARSPGDASLGLEPEAQVDLCAAPATR